MAQAFHFTGGVGLPEMLGRRAHDEQELLELLEDAPVEAIYFHTVARFLRHEVLEAAYPNDFASWAAREVRDLVLAERLGVVDPFDSKGDPEQLRQELLTTVDDHLTRLSVVPRVIHGEPFHLMRQRFVEVPTASSATDHASFEAALARVGGSAIYNHAIESRARSATPEGDFSKWVRAELEDPELAHAIGALSPFGSSIEGMRARLVALVHAARERREKKAA